MKRMLCVVLLAALCLCGCGGQGVPLQEPVRFCYLRRDTDFGKTGSLAAWEERESAQHEEDYFYLVEQYLQGPENEKLVRAFPPNVKLKKLQVIGATAKIVLNDFVSLLKGLELTLACACLTATVTEITGAQTVIISAETALLDGNPSVSMTRDQILWLDQSANANKE